MITAVFLPLRQVGAGRRKKSRSRCSDFSIAPCCKTRLVVHGAQTLGARNQRGGRELKISSILFEKFWRAGDREEVEKWSDADVEEWSAEKEGNS